MTDKPRFYTTFALALLLLGGSGSWAATNSKTVADSGEAKRKQTAQPAVDQETEAKALKLVQAHLPELKDVLKRLRVREPREYDRAVRDLVKSARKLEQAKNRDERLFDLEVELLKSQNQVNLLTAKLKVRDSKTDRKKLRESLDRLNTAQVLRAQYDVDVYTERLERAQKLLEVAEKRLKSKRDIDIDKSYSGLLRKAGREAERPAKAK